MSEADQPEMMAVAGPDGAVRHLAVMRRPPGPVGAGRAGVVWVGGFRSDMRSGKALALDSWAAERGRALLRFDYSGHGRSEGDFAAGTIGLWLADALAVLRARSQGPQILVGSSMGAWITLLAVRALAGAGEGGRVAGVVLIAPATDFTEALMWERATPDIREAVMRDGHWMRPSPYGDGAYPITRALIEEGRRHLLLGSRIATGAPVHILQGMRDEEVPWQHAMTLVEHLADDPVSITLVRDGDHRLSRPEDVLRLIAAVEGIA